VVLRGRREATGPGAGLAAGSDRRPEQCEVRFEGGTVAASVHSRAALPAGFTASGPALIQEAGSTTVIGPAGRFTVLASGNILVEID
jgi:N-methylhydantoinase A/oxoprolinase/acetone carboxylase beta subunit